MSANTPLLTEASRLASTQDVDNYSAGVAAHINGDLSRHVQVQIINKNWVDSCGNVIPGSQRLRILGTFNGVDVAIVLPILPATTQAGAAPSIISQPQDRTVGLGGSVGFTVVATGAPVLRYQWRHDGVPISGAVSPQLALTNVSLNAAGAFDCVVTNSQGIVVSNAAQLTVTFQVITQHVDSGGLFGTLLDLSLFGEPFGPF